VQRKCFDPELQALQEDRPFPRESVVALFHPLLKGGYFRISGRLQFADLSRKQTQPFLLHGSHYFTALMIMQTHIRLHHLGVRIVLSELREEFWTVRVRQTIKKVLYTCLPCKIASNPTGQEREAPMPADRVTASKPFQVTGIDFTGPLYVKGTPLLNPCYNALFTCPTIRAVRLEICIDMTTESSSQPSRDSLGAADCRIPSTLTMHKRPTRRIESLLRCGGGPFGRQNPSFHCPIRH
jgi:hypothetical protein